MIVRKALGADFWLVLDASGTPVAQGRRELCERVVAGLFLVGRQGSLFDET